jgi:SAM-dependent methyltransferase
MQNGAWRLQSGKICSLTKSLLVFEDIAGFTKPGKGALGKMIHQLINLPVGEEVKKLDGIAEGYKTYRVLAHAVDLNLFDWLEKNPAATREDICQAVDINGMFMRSYLQALVDMGMLSCIDDRYSNSEIASALLVSSSPSYQGGWFKSVAAHQSKWNNLGKVLMKDRPSQTTSGSGPDREFIQALAQRSLRGELQAVAAAVQAWDGFPGCRRLLDIGGGHGLYAIALCQANPELTATVVDLAHVTNFTREYIEAYRMTNRIEIESGDVTKDEFGSGYDIVIISHLLYKFRKDLPGIFRRVWESLNPGGLFVSNHWFCSPGCVPVGGVLELDKSLQSFGHPLCHPQEFNASLKACNFVLTRETEVPSIFGETKLHLAVKKHY